MRLTGKVAIVSGGGQGSGLATARALAAEGATVYAGDLTFPAGGVGAGVQQQSLDVTELGQWEGLLGVVLAEHDHIDILINDAGIAGPGDQLADLALDDWLRVIRTNVTGMFYGLRTIIPIMRQHGGAIVNISSIWGVTGTDGMAAYQASKGAVRSLTKNVAVTYAADRIRANTVVPGLIEINGAVTASPQVTPAVIAATPLGRCAEPEEIAAGVLYLASDDARFVTGTELVIDGGFLAL